LKRGERLMAVTTGIQKLDKIMGDGFPSGVATLIEGAPGSGKSVLAMQFLYINAQKGSGYFMFYGPDVNQLKEKFKKYGMDVSKSKMITWFDTNKKSKGENIVGCSMDDLTTLSLAMSQFYEKHKGKKISGVVTVLSPALMMNDKVIIYRFLYDMIQKLKKYGANAVFLLEEGMHTQDTVIAMEGLCDIVMQTKFAEEGEKSYRALRIKKSVNPLNVAWHKFEVTAKGINMLS
jgi:KaiC/GvpD/RAD55 family RecA-like ATPase